jgi:hypothetical protein
VSPLILNSATQITNLMEQVASFEANSRSACQEISRSLCKVIVHYRDHMSPSFVRVLNQIAPRGV